MTNIAKKSIIIIDIYIKEDYFMAEIVDKVTGTVKKTAKKVSQKATEIANLTKMTVNLENKKRELNKKYRFLGIIYYDYSKNKTEENELEIETCVYAIDELKKEISNLKIAIAKAKGEIPCPKCGEYVSKSKDKCPKCKGSLEHVVISTPKETK